MAVRFDATTDNLNRTTNLPTITSCTFMAWANRASGTGYGAIIKYGDTNSDQSYWVAMDGTDFEIFNGGTQYFGASLALNTWGHFAFTVAGTGAGQFLCYFNGALSITGSGSSAPSAQQIVLANWHTTSGEPWNGRLAHVKIYSAVLTAAEIAQEMRQALPVRTANLNCWSHLTSIDDDQIDYSGNGNNWSVGGTLATETGPPVPWSQQRERRVYIPAAAPPATTRITRSYPLGIQRGAPLRQGLVAL